MARTISKFGIKNLIIAVSLDGYKELHNYIRGVNAYDNAIELIKALRLLPHVRTLFSYILSRLNYNKVNDTIFRVSKDVPDLDINDFNFNLFETSPIYYRNSGLAPNWGEMKKMGNKFIEISKKLHEKPESVEMLIPSIYASLVNKFTDSGLTPIDCKAL